MSGEQQKICFVVMGFGKKTDYKSGRLLDLDATYESIIKPAVEAANLRCIKANEIIHSGVIDTEMYEMLFRADLVIADLSTANVNAVYELGVRHGLRPNSTIMMVESKGEFYFDLNHINTFKYEHLGTDIGYREAIRARLELENLIKSAMLSQKPDSPVYTYIPKLKQPMLSDEQYKELVNETEALQDNLSNLIEAGKHAMSASSFGDAINAFSRANQLTQNDPFVLQQLALATYKFKKPTELEALHAGLEIIKQLSPDDTNDPETLGITGAIHKRLWLATKNVTHLDFAIQYYNRGYELRRDYYNGENLALCHDYRSSLQNNAEEKIYDRICAKKTREAILASLIVLMNSSSFDDRSDKKWIYATAANCCFALGNEEQGMKHENQFLALLPAGWEITTYRENKTHTLSFINQ